MLSEYFDDFCQSLNNRYLVNCHLDKSKLAILDSPFVVICQIGLQGVLVDS